MGYYLVPIGPSVSEEMIKMWNAKKDEDDGQTVGQWIYKVMAKTNFLLNLTEYDVIFNAYFLS